MVKGVCGLPRRPGWEAISAAADRAANDTDRRARNKFESGALDFKTSIAVDLEIGGIRLFAGKLADETCDRCGRPGEQVTSGEAAVAGTRCVRCRGLDDRVVPRPEWTLPERAVPVIDAATEKRYSRPITEYWNKGRLEALMNAHHEPGDGDGSAIGRIPDFPVTRSHPPASWPSAANSSICRTYRKTAGEESRRRSPAANRWMRP